ncbi:MAG: hypothetical protein R3F55_06680 [Alphaproteobacteria bacterium]
MSSRLSQRGAGRRSARDHNRDTFDLHEAIALIRSARSIEQAEHHEISKETRKGHNHMRSIAAGIACVVAAQLATLDAQAVDFSRYSESDFVSAAEVNEGQGFLLEVEGIGVVMIGELRNPSAPDKLCQLVIPEFKRLLQDIGREQLEVQGVTEVKMAAYEQEDGVTGEIVTYCIGLGDGCSAKVSLR